MWFKTFKQIIPYSTSPEFIQKFLKFSPLVKLSSSMGANLTQFSISDKRSPNASILVTHKFKVLLHVLTGG